MVCYSVIKYDNKKVTFARAGIFKLYKAVKTVNEAVAFASLIISVISTEKSLNRNMLTRQAQILFSFLIAV